MPQPASTIANILEEIDPTADVSPLRLRQIHVECKRLLGTERSARGLARIWHAIALIQERLAHADEALKAARNAAQYAGSDWEMWLNAAIGGVTCRDLVGAEQALAEARHTAPREAAWLVAVTEALVRYAQGQVEVGRGLMLEAAAAARALPGARARVVVANQAAAIRMSALATELFAEYLSLIHETPIGQKGPIAFVDNAPPEWLRGLRVDEALAEALEETRRGLPRELWDLPQEDEELSAEELEAIEQYQEEPHDQRVSAAEMRARIESRS